MSIRLQLLLVALTTLILPWAGCQYARELESTLRASQEQALLASAGTIANTLAAQPQRLLHDPDGARRFESRDGDVYAFYLRVQPLLDGYRDDWNVAQAPLPLPTKTGLRARLQAAVTDRYLFLYTEVEDPHFDAQADQASPLDHHFDRIELAVQHPDASVESYFFATSAPGLIAAQTTVKTGDGRDAIATDSRIQAYWLQTARGYHVEIRVPLSLVGSHLWISAIDDGPAGAREAGTIGNAQARRGGRLFFSAVGLAEWLAPLIRAGARATIVDVNALKLAVSGDLEAPRKTIEQSVSSVWYRRFLSANDALLPPHSADPGKMTGPHVSAALAGHPQTLWLRIGAHNERLLSAATPIMIDGSILGAVVLEQAGDQLIGLRDQSLQRLFALTLLATAVAVAFFFGFASWLSLRIGRLRDAADNAVTAEGNITLDLPERASSDELGALSRSFTRLLQRLGEHTQYLRTLGGKLSHELRTPLTIVRSSLDNLESEGISGAQRIYLTRARDGAERLQGILTALGAAARVEESIKHVDRVNFDLRELLGATVAAYRDSFPRVAITLDALEEPCYLRGAPDLIVQMLDKLIDNAADFCPPGGSVQVRLQRAAGSYELSVSNDGPSIPPEAPGRLFEPLFESRQTSDGKPHFGLGLYIVRLIAEYHGGEARAANREEGGAIFTVSLPMI